MAVNGPLSWPLACLGLEHHHLQVRPLEQVKSERASGCSGCGAGEEATLGFGCRLDDRVHGLLDWLISFTTAQMVFPA